MNNLEKQVYQEFGEQICLFPFVSAFYSLSTDEIPCVTPCSSVKFENINWGIEKNSIIETVNTDQWKQLRENFIKGSCHTAESCKTCSLAEKQNGSSPRILNNKYFFEHIDIDFVSHIKKIVDNNYTVSDILSLDYCPSNYCNYECVMCSSGASSKRKTFELKVLGVPEQRRKEHSLAIDFEKILSTTQLINFTGGETLLQKQVHKVIDDLIEKDLAKNISISLLTNASIFPKPLIEKFKEFKNIFYTVSIDGTGPVIEYQRRGAIWSDVEKNSLKLIKEYGAVVNYVLTAVNIFNFIDFIQWLDKNKVDKVFISLVYDRNKNISIKAVPPELRAPFKQKLNKYKKIYNGTYYETLIDQMLSILENTHHDPSLIPEFVKAIRIEDSASSMSLVNIVHEWAPYFND